METHLTEYIGLLIFMETHHIGTCWIANIVYGIIRYYRILYGIMDSWYYGMIWYYGIIWYDGIMVSW